MSEYGYPTESDLGRLEGFSGTTHEYVEAITEMWSSYGGVSLGDGVDDFGKPVKDLSLVTGGWSGNESIQDVIDRSFFHFAFWRSSHRGGLVVYRISEAMWEAEWENMGSSPKVSTPSSQLPGEQQ